MPELAVRGRLGVDGIAEDPVMFSDDLVEAVPEDFQKVLVRSGHHAVKIELDDGLRAIDGLDLSFELGVLEFGCGYVGCELHNFKGIPVQVEDWVVGGLEPDLRPVLGEALEFCGVVLAPGEFPPEFGIFVRRRVDGITEDSVVLTDHFIGAVTEDAQKVVVRCEHSSVETEFDDRLGAVDGLDLAFELGISELRGSHIRREFHHSDELTVLVQHRVVRGLEPDFRPVLGEPLEFSGVLLALG